MSWLTAALSRRDATIGMIGLGYVGLPLSLAFVDAGYDVAGFDIDAERIARLRDGDSYVDDVSDEALSEALKSGFAPSDDPESVAGCEAYVIAVPTGITNGEPAMGAVEAAAETVAEQAESHETLVVVSSTVYPGATNEVVAPIVTADRPADRTHVAMVPERLNPGSDHAINDIPLVVGANDEPSHRAAFTLFSGVVAEVVPVDSTETAELSKTLENTYRMVNIALVNQLVALAEQLDGDIWAAIEAAGTKPFGFQAFKPGPGVGGHCIPIDPQFLTWRAKRSGTELPLIENAHRINESMPGRVVEGVTTALEARGVGLDTATVLLLGAAYKPNVADARHSPPIEVFESLRSLTDTTLVDPHVDPAEAGVPIEASVTDDMLADADAVVLLVDHDAFALDRVGDRARFVYDTRNAMPENVSATVVTLGERPEIVHSPGPYQ